MANNKTRDQDPTLRELDAIKRLLILFLIKSGASQKEISAALEMDQGNFSRMFPARKIKRFTASNDD